MKTLDQFRINWLGTTRFDIAGGTLVRHEGCYGRITRTTPPYRNREAAADEPGGVEIEWFEKKTMPPIEEIEVFTYDDLMGHFLRAIFGPKFESIQELRQWRLNDKEVAELAGSRSFHA